MVNNTMLLQVAIRGWRVLNESLLALNVVGLGVAGLGALLVQLRGG